MAQSNRAPSYMPKQCTHSHLYTYATTHVHARSCHVHAAHIRQADTFKTA